MSGSSSTILTIAGIGVGLLALLLLFGSSPEPATPMEGVTPIASSSDSTITVVSPISSALEVHIGPDQTVGEREQVELTAEVANSGGRPVTYLWTAQGGLGFFSNAHSASTVFTAPSACDCNETVILTLTATDSSGRSSTDQMVLFIRDPLNCPETTCDASAYHVTVPGNECQPVCVEPVCPATPSEPCQSPCIAEAPAAGGCDNVAVPCPCTENVDCSEPWQTGWPFDATPVGHPKDRAKPSIGRHFPREMNESATTQLQGYIRNPACQSVCYSWVASKGWLENTHTLTPTYHAPESDRLEGETVTISLIVYDAAQGRSYDQIRIKIRNTNPG